VLKERAIIFSLVKPCHVPAVDHTPPLVAVRGRSFGFTASNSILTSLMVVFSHVG